MAGPATPPGGAIALCAVHPDVCGEMIEAPARIETVAVAVQSRAEAATQKATGGRQPNQIVTLRLDAAPVGEGGQVSVDREAARVESISLAQETTPLRDGVDALPEASPSSEDHPIWRATRLPADEATLNLLNRVNRDINRRMSWRSDQDIYATDEYWTMPLTLGLGAQGDCEDFALEKRHALIEAGVPNSALALATAYSPRTGFHAVLIARLETGDVVLDNETPWILPWRETGYVWQSVQSGPTLLDWARIDMSV